MEFCSVGPLFFFLLVFAPKPSCAEGEEANIVEMWNTTKQRTSYKQWEEYVTNCTVQEICPKDSKECTGDKVPWKDLEIHLQNSKEIVIMDDQTFQEITVNHTLKQTDLDFLLNSTICDMTLIQKRAGGGCFLLWIPNQCPWNSFTDDEAYDDTKDCDKDKEINKEEVGFFPRNCVAGAGWEGKLETFIEGDSYKINWTSLVKRPACVHSITLAEEKTRHYKYFTTMWSDKNFPIAYRRNACELNIKVTFWKAYESSQRIYSTYTTHDYSSSSDFNITSIPGTP